MLICFIEIETTMTQSVMCRGAVVEQETLKRVGQLPGPQLRDPRRRGKLSNLSYG